MKHQRLITDEILIPKSHIIRFRSISKEAVKFSTIFNKFITETNQELDYDDFIMCLRTHLLFRKYSLRKISKYIKEIVLPNLNEYISNLKKSSVE